MSSSPPLGQLFELYLQKADFKFSAAHFVSHGGVRERLHGHNYAVSLAVRGRAAPPGAADDDGCLVDFGELKRAMRAVCAELDERFLCPLHSRSVRVRVREAEARVELFTIVGSGDGTESEGAGATDCCTGEVRGQGESGALLFSFPLGDCSLLPLANSTAEELSVLIAGRVEQQLGRARLRERRVESLTVGVAETAGQEARYTLVL